MKALTFSDANYKYDIMFTQKSFIVLCLHCVYNGEITNAWFIISSINYINGNCGGLCDGHIVHFRNGSVL